MTYKTKRERVKESQYFAKLGRLGGAARAESLSSTRRREIAKQAADAATAARLAKKAASSP